MTLSMLYAQGIDIDILLKIQAFREATGYALDFIMNAVTFAGDVYPMMMLMTLVYWCIHKRSGICIVAAAAYANFIGNFTKCLFCVYRPWIRNPAVEPVASALKGATGYSFPSGHTINAVAVYGAGSAAARDNGRKKLSMLLVLPAVLIPLSRLYCEVHTPQDVLTGCGLSLIFLFASRRLLEIGDRSDDAALIRYLIAITALALAAILYISFKAYPMDIGADGELLADPAVLKKDAFKMTGIFIGANWGYLIERRYVHFTTEGMTLKKALTRFVPGFLGLVILAMGIGKGFDMIFGYLPGHFITYILVGLYCLGLYPMLFTYFEGRAAVKGDHRD
ncbi:phosphatase PAP2 family protein [Butyrivibrio sp. MC2013]|uniref:phosphatase PAP2 family protein n=1 Tax=Butyrivibrio sp. MC2013 TaxID=1280686 RepID=UPI000408230E|nr:phosphatase PAP2 family protein [Butyrivibrio sp. MC2013]